MVRNRARDTLSRSFLMFSGDQIAELLDELFLTRSPTLFGRLTADGRKGLIDGVDLAGREVDLLGVVRKLDGQAISRIDAEQAKDLPGTPATASQSFYLDSEWWAKNGKAVEKRFQEWLLTAK